jgi:hypothetical protein
LLHEPHPDWGSIELRVYSIERLEGIETSSPGSSVESLEGEAVPATLPLVTASFLLGPVVGFCPGRIPAFAGLDPDRYSILWVRHQHAGHHELHFVTPRVELATGKSLNIHPPGRASQTMFDTFRSQVNAEYGLADPDDPARARDVSLPNHLAKIQADASRKGQPRKVDIRDAITTAVRREVDAGRVKDRRGVERYLERLGFTFTRRGKDYVTVVHPDTRERIRLKGSLYSREGFNARETAEPGVIYGVPDPGRAAELATTLAPMVEARARFHQQRYAVARDQGAQQDIVPPGGTQEPLRAYMERHLGAEALRASWQQHRQRTRTAINAQPQDPRRPYTNI